MTSEAFISTVFTFVNFGVFCTVAFFYFKNSQLPGIRGKIATKKSNLDDMHLKNKALLEMKKEVIKKTEEQEILSKKLYEQIKSWSLFFEAQQKEYENEKIFLKKEAVKRANKRVERKLSLKANNAVFSIALNSAKKDLSDNYISEDKGRQFISSIIDYMREEIQ